MLDIKLLQKDIDFVIEKLKSRNVDKEILQKISTFINSRNRIISELGALQHKRNSVTKEIAILSISKEESKPLVSEAMHLKQAITKLEEEINQYQKKIEKILYFIPNIPSELTPIGNDENDNKIIEVFDKLGRGLVKAKKAHYEIGVEKDILDFVRAVKISGSRFVFFKKEGAQLVRALENFMLDVHIKNGYVELLPPLIVNQSAMYGTGQLPKFKEDLYKIDNEQAYLISTAEIPLTNYYYDEIINLEQSRNFCAYTPCFRSEAGSAGKDTKGLIRSHQFNKVELVKITSKKDALKEFDKTVADAELILKLLEIPYRRIVLCTGDLGFSSKITYDLELWLPSEQRFREVSSISYFGDFQARRAKIRYKDKDGKSYYAHTINGSGLAIDRVIAALLEIYQNDDGSIEIPKVLVPYMSNKKKI